MTARNLAASSRSAALLALLAVACSGDLGTESRSDESPRNGSGGATGSHDASAFGPPVADAGAGGGGGQRTSGSDESANACADIVPSSRASFDGVLAGPGAKLLVQVRPRDPAASLSGRWTWRVLPPNTATFIQPTTTGADGAVADIATDQRGRYELEANATVGGKPCRAQRIVFAYNAEEILGHFRVRATPPGNAGLAVPIQELRIEVGSSSSPVVRDLFLERGELVSLEPQNDNNSAVASYIRLSQVDSAVTLEGHTAQLKFSTFLLPLALYDVLVVPDPRGDDPMPPMFYRDRTGRALQTLPQTLDPGIRINGRVLDESGAPVADARMLLRAGALSSTVGASNAEGHCSFRVREGTFAALVSPPPGSGLPEAQIAMQPGITVTSAVGAVEFRWKTLPTARLSLLVRDLDGSPAGTGARVRIELDSPLADVGAFVVSPTSAMASTHRATGTVRATAGLEALGTVEFAKVPRGRYRATLIPADADNLSALTTTTLDLSAGDIAGRELRFVEKVAIRGQITPIGTTAGVRILAFPLAADPPRPAATAEVKTDGSYELKVDPGRTYTLVADPGIDKLLARGQLGAVEVGSSTVSMPERRLPSALVYEGRVMVASQPPVAGVVLQVFCLIPSADCPDPSIPLAETVSDGSGRFRLLLPDPATR